MAPDVHSKEKYDLHPWIQVSGSCRTRFTAISGYRDPQAQREGWGLVGTCFPEHRAFMLSAPANLIVRSATRASPQYEKP
jgi:hypothetical protein